jgi:Na+-translocating ferredoxin:NAD+ oxidoreductase RNF subunit RnfB
MGVPLAHELLGDLQAAQAKPAQAASAQPKQLPTIPRGVCASGEMCLPWPQAVLLCAQTTQIQ